MQAMLSTPHDPYLSLDCSCGCMCLRHPCCVSSVRLVCRPFHTGNRFVLELDAVEPTLRFGRLQKLDISGTSWCPQLMALLHVFLTHVFNIPHQATTLETLLVLLHLPPLHAAFPNLFPSDLLVRAVSFSLSSAYSAISSQCVTFPDNNLTNDGLMVLASILATRCPSLASLDLSGASQ